MISNKKAFNIAMVGVLAALIAASAFIRVPLPFMPLTLQVFMVLIAPMIFGVKISFAAVFLYLVTGLIGFPVFSAGGGPAYVFQPSFGYLIGFLLSTIPCGLIASRKGGPLGLFFGGFLALIVLELCGTLGLWLNFNLYQGKAVSFAFVTLTYALPFYLPDFVKLIIAVLIACKLKSRLKQAKLQ